MVTVNSQLIPSRSKQANAYYKRIENLLAGYSIDDACIENGAPIGEDKEERNRIDTIIAKIAIVLNVFLLLAKSFATYLTSGTSLSIISTLMDSIFDITSGIAVWWAMYAITNTDFFKYPRGREKLEILATCFVGTVMATVNFIIILKSLDRIIMGGDPPLITIPSLILIFVTIFVKTIMFFACYKRGTKSCMVLAEDQKNDVLTNIVAILGAFISRKWFDRADAIAACLISGYVFISWALMVRKEIPNLVGYKCSDEEFARIGRVVIQHSERIKCIDTLLVYHNGDKVQVEVHVVMDPETTSKIVHDEVLEPLQRKLMSLPFVERAFVHADYELDGTD